MLKKFLLWIFQSCAIVFGASLNAQPPPRGIPDSLRNEIAFVSDTQAPMRAEKVVLKSNHNTEATKLIFDDITRRAPRSLFILGDVVSWGPKEKKWKDIDQYLATARKNGIPVHAQLGNHDVMGSASKGQKKFSKRFPDQVSTGYFVIVDSIAVVLLNSNFKTLSTQDRVKQQSFYEETLRNLDENPGVKWIIVTCHHAPYTNSTIVSSSTSVQQFFVPLFVKSKKAKLFITGHAHAFERFQLQGKDFLTIGGGGGLHHPLRQGKDSWPNSAIGYDPEFQYITIRREPAALSITSFALVKDFSHFTLGYQFTITAGL